MRAKGCPIGWSEQHDGFWVVTSYEHVWQVLRDPETFSSDYDQEGERAGGGGIFIPTRGGGWRPQHLDDDEEHSPGANAYGSRSGRLIPVEVDPPDTTKLRRIVMPFLSPDGVKPLEPNIREYVTRCLNEHIETGSIDLIHDLASAVPAMLTMHMFGLPVDGWERWATPLHNAIAEPEGTPAHALAQQGLAQMRTDIDAVLEERRRHPKDDILGAIAGGTIDGVPLSPNAVHEFVMTVLAGGVDTTTSLLGHTFAWLNDHHDDRQRLIDHPELLDSACEEFLRWSTPNPTVARTATRDVEIGGQLIRKGDRVLVERSSANRDAARFECPNDFKLDRFPNPHMSFGMGVHRCLGSNVTRLEFNVVVGEVLRRIPDYHLVPGASVRYPVTGVMDGWKTMPATFRPGVKIAVDNIS
jgi:cytochrome P450